MKPEQVKMVTRGVEEEPSVGSGEIPVLFFSILAALLFLAILYLDRYAGGFDSQVYHPFASIDEVRALQVLPPGGDDIRKGKKVYEVSCQICHQPNGLGTPGQFPPLDGSEWVTGAIARLAPIPIIGLSGPIVVNGEPWNAAMPAMGAALSDDEMAALLTYIRQAWSNKAGPVKVDEIKKVKTDLTGRSDPMTAEELLAIPAQ